MDNSPDIVLVFSAQGIAGVLGLLDGFQILVEAGRDVQADHIHPGHHHFPGDPVGEFENFIEQGQLRLVDDPALVALGDQHADLLFVVRLLMFRNHLHAQPAQDAVGSAIQEEDERVKQPVKPMEGGGCPNRRRFGAADGQGFGRHLPEDDV